MSEKSQESPMFGNLINRQNRTKGFLKEACKSINLLQEDTA